MTSYEILTLILTTCGIVLVPLVIMLFRVAMRWSKVESKLDEVISDVKRLVVTSDKRIRWLEENVWRRNRPQ